MIERFEKLFEKYTDRFIFEPWTAEFIFNHTVSGDKTLLYLACQLGNIQVVEFLLKKKLLTTTLCKTNGSDNKNKNESILDCAARWGYSDIVDLLLEKGNLPTDYIKTASNLRNIPTEIRDKLKKALSKCILKKKNRCSCF